MGDELSWEDDTLDRYMKSTKKQDTKEEHLKIGDLLAFRPHFGFDLWESGRNSKKVLALFGSGMDK